MQQPVSQAPPTHASFGRIEYGKEGSLFRPFENIFDQFQIALRLRIKNNEIFAAVWLWCLEVREEILLRFFDIGKQRASRNQRTRIREGQGLNCSAPKGGGQQSQRRLSSKLLFWSLSNEYTRMPVFVKLLSYFEDDFLRLKFAKKAREIYPGGLGHEELACRQLKKGSADVFALRHKSCQGSFFPS